MGTISDKLMRIINTKEDIRQALISKGYDVPTSIPFKEYAKMISDLPCRVDSFPDIEGIVARYSALGLANEQMAENPVWVDKTGNGHDLQMKNFAWGGMSWVGGYTENYNSNKWYKVESRIDVTWTYKSFNARSIKDNRSAQLFYQSSLSDTGFRVLSCTIKVSGLTDGQGIEYVSNGTQQFVIMRIENDGIYHLPSFDFGAKNAYYGFKFLKLQESCNITIEQLPLYPGALVFDGVDDYGVCDNFPILTKEKGYTVVALRQWLSFQDIGYPTLVVNSTDRLAAFSFEDFRNKTKSTWNWGKSVGLSDYKIPLLYTYQTSTSYNSKTISAGATEEGSNILQVCRSGFYCANAAIWEIVILDHDATEEELTKIKDYFVKTYPWLFPDQAWTVTGKTNEDEDRATIANITGNGNDLVLSNFGFAEGSGYNEEGEYAGYLVTDGVDDEVRSAAFTLNKDWTIVGNWEFITNENKNAGLTKVYSLYLYNRDYGIFVYIYKNAGQGFSVKDVKSLKAICSDGRIYLNDWQEIRNNIEQEATISKGVMAIGYFNRDFTKVAFKNLGIYNNQLLSKDDCIKAYNYLQTLKSK